MTTTHTPSRGLHLTTWVLQGLLALALLGAGSSKLMTPLTELAATLPWVLTMPEALVRFIGLAEVLGGIGLVLPAATRIRPSLTPLAAAGLVIVMVLAAGFHVSRGELAAVPVNAVLGGLAGLIAWARWTRVPISGR